MEDIKKELKETNHQLEETSDKIHRITMRLVKALEVVYNKPSVIFWRGFIKGIGQGLGATIGVAIIFLVLSWLLKQLGGIPAFADWVNSVNNTFNVPR